MRAQLFPPTQYTTPPPQLNSPVREVQMSPGITMVTIIASVGGACCVILIILQVVVFVKDLHFPQIMLYFNNDAYFSTTKKTNKLY